MMQGSPPRVAQRDASRDYRARRVSPGATWIALYVKLLGVTIPRRK